MLQLTAKGRLRVAARNEDGCGLELIAEPGGDQADAAVEQAIIEGGGGVRDLVGVLGDAGGEHDGGDAGFQKTALVADPAVEDLREGLAPVVIIGEVEAGAAVGGFERGAVGLAAAGDEVVGLRGADGCERGAEQVEVGVGNDDRGCAGRVGSRMTGSGLRKTGGEGGVG